MRRSGFVVTLLILTAAACAGPSVTEVGDGTVHWRLDGADSIGGFAVEPAGRPTIVDSPRGKALLFDGGDDALFVDGNPLEGADVLTAEVVFRPYPDGAREQRFVHLQEDASDDRLLIETRLTRDGQWFLDTFIESAGRKYTLYAKRFPHEIGPWYHAALVVDGARMRHYVNGVEEMSREIDYFPQGSGRTSIGVRINRVHWYRGEIREIRFTPRVLSPEQFLKP